MNSTPIHIANGAMVFGAFRRIGSLSISPRPASRCRKAAGPSSKKIGGHPTGNPGKPAVVLANLRRSTTGLKAGTSSSPARSPDSIRSRSNQPVTGEFEGFGTMEATIVRLDGASSAQSDLLVRDRRPTAASAAHSPRSRGR